METKKRTAAKNYMRRIAGGIWFCFAALAGGAVGAGAISGTEVMAKAQEKFSEYKTFSARFEQEFHWVVLDRKVTQAGRIYTQRPGHFRLEINGGDLFVADGQTIWSYSPKNEQVLASYYDGEIKTPWEVLVDYTEAFDPVAVEEVRLGRHDCYLLTLKPQVEASGIAQLRVWIDRKKWDLLKVEKVETDDNTTVYTLKDHRINKKIDAALFRFEMPADVEFIDRREENGAGR
jgi:chaperone LolA